MPGKTKFCAKTAKSALSIKRPDTLYVKFLGAQAPRATATTSSCTQAWSSHNTPPQAQTLLRSWSCQVWHEWPWASNLETQTSKQAKPYGSRSWFVELRIDGPEIQPASVYVPVKIPAHGFIILNAGLN